MGPLLDIVRMGCMNNSGIPGDLRLNPPVRGGESFRSYRQSPPVVTTTSDHITIRRPPLCAHAGRLDRHNIPPPNTPPKCRRSCHPPTRHPRTPSKNQCLATIWLTGIFFLTRRKTQPIYFVDAHGSAAVADRVAEVPGLRIQEVGSTRSTRKELESHD